MSPNLPIAPGHFLLFSALFVSDDTMISMYPAFTTETSGHLSLYIFSMTVYPSSTHLAVIELTIHNTTPVSGFTICYQSPIKLKASTQHLN